MGLPGRGDRSGFGRLRGASARRDEEIDRGPRRGGCVRRGLERRRKRVQRHRELDHAS